MGKQLRPVADLVPKINKKGWYLEFLRTSCKIQQKIQSCEADVEIYRCLFFGSMYMGTTFCQRGAVGPILKYDPMP